MTKPMVKRFRLALDQLPMLKGEFRQLIIALKRSTDWKTLRRDCGGQAPWVDLTIGCTFLEDGIAWDYQTGDNSYTGGAYGHPEWFTTCFGSRSNSGEIAGDLVDEITERIHTLGYCAGQDQ